MKSFFVIKGETSKQHQWFDQQGKPIPFFQDTDLPYVTSDAVSATACDFVIDNPNEVPRIILSFHVKVCDNIEQVEYLSIEQNIF